MKGEKILKSNSDIRTKAKEKRVYLWEIAEKLEISEPTITRKLRRELSCEEKEQIFAIIEEIAAEKAATVAEKGE